MRRRFGGILGGLAAWTKPSLHLLGIPGYIDDGQSWLRILITVGNQMTSLDWILLAVGVPAFFYGLTPARWRFWERVGHWVLESPLQLNRDRGGHLSNRSAWQIPGARTKSFRLYEAACLFGWGRKGMAAEDNGIS